MKRVACFCFCLLGSCLPLVAQSDGASSPDTVTLREPIPDQSDPVAEKLIATSFKAKGGLTNFLAMRNVKMTTKIREGRRDFERIFYFGYPDKIRIETITRQRGEEFKVIEGFDGENAWVYDLTQKHPFPQEVGGARKKEMARTADFHGPLANWQTKGYVAEYLGPVNSRRFKNYVVKLYDEQGIPQYFYFDAKNYLLTRHGWPTIRNDVIVNHDHFYVKYEKVRGVYLPTTIEMAIESQTYGEIAVENLEFDQTFPPGFFEIPKVKEVWLRGKNRP